MAPIFTGLKFGFGSASQITNFSSTGGNIIPSSVSGNGFTYHVFLQPDVFTIATNTNIDILVIGGGGSGGSTLAGGGGAGGIIRHPALPVVSTTSYLVGVGTGGASHQSAAPTSVAGNDGFPSTFGSPVETFLTALGGGSGGAYAGTGFNGGSGGGGGNHPVIYNGGSATQPTQPQPATPGYVQYGNPGFAGASNANIGGGGGGAGSGGPITSGIANGGSGQPFPSFAYPIIQTGIPVPLQPTFGPAVGPTGLYGGGGGAGARSGYTAGSGGPGGGGNGNSAGAANDGVDGTGGGGGSAGYPDGGTPIYNGAGGDGIVIIRYQI